MKNSMLRILLAASLLLLGIQFAAAFKPTAMPDTTALPDATAAPDTTAAPQHWSQSARQLLYSVRMRVKGSKGRQIASGEKTTLEMFAWETRLPVFVISLKHRQEERLAKYLLNLRWYEDLHVVEAVDGRTLEPIDRMTSGEIACFESHRKAWKRVVDGELRQAIIMEDDAVVDLSVHMKDIVAFASDAPPDWQILYLGINNDKVPMSSDLFLHASVKLVSREATGSGGTSINSYNQDIRNVTANVAEPVHYILGAHAYLIRGAVAARLHALSEIPPYRDTYKPVDIWLTEQGLKIYIINPPLVKPRNLRDSDTQGIRTKTHNATRLLLNIT